MAAAAPVAPDFEKRVKPLRAGRGSFVSLAEAAFALGDCADRGVPGRAYRFELRDVNGPLAYAQQVKFLNSLPLVRVLEWGFIFIPLAFHALYGVCIAFRGRANVNVYPWAGNWMYI